MNLARLREDTPGCARVNHLNNAGAALMPRQVVQAMQDYLSAEELRGGYETADAEAEKLNGFYDAAARLMNCHVRNIAYTASATDSYSKALSAVPFEDGDVVLISENDYPSNYISFLSLQKRLGIKLIPVGNVSSGEMDLNDLEDKLKKHSPKLVSVSHVPTSSGLVQPAAEIGRLVRRYDALYLLDACQSLGQMEVDALTTQADFLSGTMRKFLRGPRGAGLLYVSDEALNRRLEPALLEQRGAAWTGKDRYEPRADAKRFENWERAYALVAGSTEALNYLLWVGIKNVEQRNTLLRLRLKSGLAALPNIRLQDRGREQCNIITFSTQGGTPEQARQYFHERGINVYTSAKSAAMFDFEEKGIDWVVRVSPHYYNTEEEIDAFVEAAREI